MSLLNFEGANTPDSWLSLTDDLFNDLAISSTETRDSDKYAALQNKLVTNPYYFFVWGNSFLPPVDTFGEKEQQCFIKAMTKEESSRPLPRSMKDMIKFVLRQDLDESNKPPGGEICVGFFVEAFIRTWAGLQGASKEATRCLRGGQKCMELKIKKGMDSDYLDGILYLSRWAQLAIYLKKGKIPPPAPPNEPKDYDGEREFNALSNKAKAMVLAAKVQFLCRFTKGSTEAGNISIETLQKIANDLDPLAYEWHYKLGNWMRCERRRNSPGNRANPPSKEELKILWETYDVCEYQKTSLDDPSELSGLRRIAFAGLCQAIAEVIKCRFYSKVYDFPVQIGGLEFNHQQEMVDYVLDGVKKMMTQSKHERIFAELMRAGEIVSNILPPKYRDYFAAEEYLLEALKLRPTRSKLNHKLGVLYLISDELRDMGKAVSYFKTALESEKANFPAAMDLINTLLSSAEEHEEELENLISSRLTDNQVALLPKDHQQLLFSDGCLKFLTGYEEDAVKLWITAQQANPLFGLFWGVAATAKRHRWNKTVAFWSVRKALIEFVETHVDLNETDKDTIGKMLISFPDQKRLGTGLQQTKTNNPTHHSSSDADLHWRRSETKDVLTPSNCSNSPNYVPPSGNYVPPQRRTGNCSNSMSPNYVPPSGNYVPPQRRTGNCSNSMSPNYVPARRRMGSSNSDSNNENQRGNMNYRERRE